MTRMLNYLFDSDILNKACPEIVAGIPKGYTLRPLARDDYSYGVLSVLTELTTVGDINQVEFQNRFDYMQNKNDEYYILVIASESTSQVVAVGSLVLERKFIHQCSLVGHIEDIAVSKQLQGSGLGNKLIASLCAIAKYYGAYKAILDCSAKNEKFYEKCDFHTTGLMMTNKLQ